MNFKQMVKKLRKYKIHKNMYSLDGGLPDEKFCIEHIGDKWFTYHSEKGMKTSLKEFNTEGEACEYFFETLVELEKMHYR